MFTPLVQGKESRIREDAHLVVPGRFRAHANNSSSSTNNGSSNRTAPDPRASVAGPSSAFSGAPRAYKQPPTTPTKRRRRPSTRFRNGGEDHSGREGQHQHQANERTWLLRPSRDRVETWLDAWWKRWLVLVIVPSVIVWTWCAIPFPVSDPYDPNLPWPDPGWNWTHHYREISRVASVDLATTVDTNITPSNAYRRETNDSLDRRRQGIPAVTETAVPIAAKFRSSLPSSSTNGSTPPSDSPVDLPVDVNFWFFLVVYYGAYLAVALIWVTCLFNLYRLNWWPSKLGGRMTYFCFWTGALVVGTLVHHFDIFGIQKHRNSRKHPEANVDWERKTFWVSLAFATMAMPAVICFGKLRRDRRMTYRHSLTEHQRTFLEIQLGRRIPKSYIRFLWFVACTVIAIFSGLAGQAYLSVYLSTLPHGNIESIVYVWTWIISCGLFGNLTGWILEKKVGSKALDFVFRLYFQLVYHVFYRTLFARLRKAEQFLYIQLLSSIWIVTFYPAWMSRTAHKLFKWLLGADRSYADHAESVAVNLYVRNLSENVTMVAFLGWLTILHFGPNREVYPFFDFSEKDPYNYRRTAISSLIIWFFELLSSFIARLICNLAFKVDVTNTGLDTLRDYPELLPACVWASVHVCMDILLFLVTYNFR